jgi:nicotinate-nucleotide pyrophosphorylase (carboxylating)
MAYFDEATRRAAAEAVKTALAEDLGARGDITTEAVIPEGIEASGSYVYKEDAVVVGVDVLEEISRQISKGIVIEVLKGDGEAVSAGETALRIIGPARALLAAERTSLNFLSHLSGVATLTRRFVEAAAGTKARIYDTRKTLPGLRVLEKYAVRCGGGENHRMGLFDQVLVKDNHIALMRRSGKTVFLAEALAEVKKNAPQGVIVEVEATTLVEVDEALAAGADIILLDNMSNALMKKAVARAAKAKRRPLLEASGHMTLRRVAAVAATGVDRISVGALTHSAPSVDISLEIA